MNEATRKYSRRYYLADRDRFLADGGGCEMRKLGELLCDECYSEATTIDAFLGYLIAKEPILCWGNLKFCSRKTSLL
jgi:hypothetical protein